jgi:hypothetical protein
LPKLTILALGSIQRLLTIEPANQKLLSTVIGTLRVQAESDDEGVQLKILQTLLQAISSRTIEMLQGSLLQALGICFRLYALKTPV